MIQTPTVERLTDAMARAQKHWREHHPEAAGKAEAVTIALSRQAGVPGTTIAHALGTKLGWAVYDHELLERLAQEMGFRVELLESVDERRQSWLRESLEAFSSVPSVSENSYVRHLIETILSLGTHGECIIVGRGAAQILPVEHTLRVRLLGTFADRVTNTARRLNLSRADAERWVTDTDRQREEFIRAHLQQDPTDATHYDLLLNTSRWDLAECVDLIVAALRAMQARRPK